MLFFKLAKIEICRFFQKVKFCVGFAGALLLKAGLPQMLPKILRNTNNFWHLATTIKDIWPISVSLLNIYIIRERDTDRLVPSRIRVRKCGQARAPICASSRRGCVAPKVAARARVEGATVAATRAAGHARGETHESRCDLLLQVCWRRLLRPAARD